MQGMDRSTGKWLGDIAHIEQSVKDILTTRLGTRILRRNYGGTLPDMIDRPMQQDLIAKHAVDVAMDIDEWEPRVSLKRMQFIDANSQGKGHIELQLEYNNQDIIINI